MRTREEIEEDIFDWEEDEENALDELRWIRGIILKLEAELNAAIEAEEEEEDNE